MKIYSVESSIWFPLPPKIVISSAYISLWSQFSITTRLQRTLWNNSDVLFLKKKKRFKHLGFQSKTISGAKEDFDFQRAWFSDCAVNCCRDQDKERNEKAVLTRVCSCIRYNVIVHIEDNTWITKCSNDIVYEILSRKLISSCYRLPSCGGEMKEKLYIKRPCGALCLSHFIFQLKLSQ